MTQTSATKPLSCLKEHFSLPEGLHYLNCAYMSPLSKSVEAAGFAGVRRKSVPTELPPESFFEESAVIKRLFAELVNGDAGRVALMPSASYGLATVANNLKLTKGQTIVVAHEQFPSNVYVWRRFVEQGVEIRTVAPAAGANRAQSWNERLLGAIDATTGLVALPHVHWTDGTLFDLEAIGERAREVGAAFVVDGTQSIGALPLDVARLRPDALVVAGYKTLTGPYGIGCAHYGPRFDGGRPLEETWVGRSGSEDFSRLVDYQDAYGPGAARFDMGERSNPILQPMLIAALEQLLEWQPDRVQAYCRTLVRSAVESLRELGYEIETKQESARHLFGIRLPKTVSLERVKVSLEARNVIVSVRGSAVRVSPSVYNDEADIQALLEVLKHASR